MEKILQALKAAGEETRMRLLALCAKSDLTVSEMVEILGQSQPRVSRHLKLLTDANLLERFREGVQVYYRTPYTGLGADMLDFIEKRLDSESNDILKRDMRYLEEIHLTREDKAKEFFANYKKELDLIKDFYPSYKKINKEVIRLLPPVNIKSLLDIGTGAGDLLKLYKGKINQLEGIDISSNMLNVARINLEKAGVLEGSVRKADVENLPFNDKCFDAVVLDQILSFVVEPQYAVAEACRVAVKDGFVLVVDLLKHEEDSLKERLKHYHYGFAYEIIESLLAKNGFNIIDFSEVKGKDIVVGLWLAKQKH